MGIPASHPEFRRTCPVCNRTVRSGYKFCEVCGTRIPDLLTCSKCGTQFIHVEKFCPLCGAPSVLREMPEPDTDEIPEPHGEKIPEKAADKVPGPDKEEIPEPDTDELLELYGAEYGENETLESYHKQKPASPLQYKAKRAVTVPALQGRGSSETVDDALFLLNKEPVQAKSPVNRIRIIGGIVLITILAAIFFIGQPMLMSKVGFGAHSSPTAAEITSLPEPAIARTTQPTLAAPPSRALVPLPTQPIPTDQKFYFQVQKNPITSKISVIFAGSAGEGSISSANIKVTHRDGSVSTGVILPLKGVSEIILDGSREPDRVEIIAKMSSGETFRVYDDLVSFMRY